MMAFVCSGPIIIWQELPKLAQLPEIELVDEDLSAQMSLPLCLAFITQKQTLITQEKDNVVWGNLPSHWWDGEGYLLGYHNQAYYERQFSQFSLVRSTVFFDNKSPFNEVGVSNTFVLSLPEPMCQQIQGN